MSLVMRYARYAEAFEVTYGDDNWSRLREYFTEDAVYRAAPPFEADARGIDAILSFLQGSVNAFDRRFSTRRLVPKGVPREEGDRVVMEWEAFYEVAGAPELRLAGTETAVFRGDRICLLQDEFVPGIREGLEAWFAANGSKLA